MGFAVEAGVKLVPLATDPGQGYGLPPLEKIEQKITGRTRAILLCSPNNPTGTLLSREVMGGIADLARRKNVFVLSDEVYREFCYTGKHTSIWEFEEIAERAIMLDSISKRYSACGARVGCLASRNKQVMDAALRLGQARLCSPTIEQIAAARVMDLPQSYYTALADEYRARRDTIVDLFNKIPGCFCRKPLGAFYFMGTFPVADIEDFCRWMLTDFNHENQTVMMAPGPGFYATPGMGKNEARIAYVLEKEKLIRAVKALRLGLAEYQQTH
jgi:aspartate aminotransferase